MQKGPGSEKLSEKEQKILDLLKDTPSGLSFTEILEKYPFSKGTFNRYLNQLVDRGLILKKKNGDHARAQYLIQVSTTPLSTLIPPQWTKIITFFGEFGVPEDFIPDLALLLSYMGDKFLELEQSPELYLALFYVYQNCIWVPRAIHIGPKEFCASYVKPFPQLTTISLEYHVNKLVTKDLGLMRVTSEIWDYFFHVKDQFGQALHACVQESLQKALFKSEMAPIVQEARPHELRETVPPDEEEETQDAKKVNLKETAEVVLRWLVDHQFLPENLKDAFYTAVGNVILACAVELHIPPEYLPTDITQKPPTGIQTDKIRGFCKTCGEWITWGEATCSYCRAPVDQDSLIASIVEARQRRRQYRAEIGETTFACPHCGFVLQKAWQEKQCPACKKELPEDPEKNPSETEKLGEKLRKENQKNSMVNKPREEKPEILSLKVSNTNQPEEEKKKISPQLQEILDRNIKKFKEIKATEKIYDPTPQEKEDYVSQWGFDPIKNKIPLAGGYFYTADSINFENDKFNLRSIGLKPYIYAYPSESTSGSPPQENDQGTEIFQYIIVEHEGKQVPVPCSLVLLAFFNQILKIDESNGESYPPWRQLIILRELVKKIASWDIWGEQFALNWLPKIKIYAAIGYDFQEFYTDLINAIMHLNGPRDYNFKDLFFYLPEKKFDDLNFDYQYYEPEKKNVEGEDKKDAEWAFFVSLPKINTQPIKKEQVFTIKDLIDQEDHIEYHPEKLYQYENCLVNTPLLLRMIEISQGSLLIERMHGDYPEAVHFLTFYPEPQERSIEELIENVEDPVGTKKGYSWEGNFSEFWKRYHSITWCILAVNTNTTSFDRRLKGLSSTCSNLEVRKKFFIREDLATIALSHDGRQIFGGLREGIIKAWDATTGKEEKKFAGHDRTVTSLYVTPDGQYLLSSSEDGELRRWNLSTGECLEVITKGEEKIDEIALTSDEKSIITLSEKGIIKCREIETGTLLFSIPLPEQATENEDRLETASPIARPQITSDGCGVLYVKRGGEIGLFDIMEKKVIKSYIIFSAAICLATSHDARYFVAGGEDGDLKIVSIDGDEKVQEIHGLQTWIISTALFLGKKYVISGLSASRGDMDEGTVRIWETQTGLPVELRLTLTGAIGRILVDPKETYFCYNSPSTLKVYSIGEVLSKKSPAGGPRGL